MYKIIVSTFIGIFLLVANCNAQNDRVRLLKSDTAWLDTVEMYVYKITTTMPNPAHAGKHLDKPGLPYITSEQKYVSFVGTNKLMNPLDRKLAFYYKKSPDALALYTKARKLNNVGNFALLSPYPILLVTKEISGQKYFWDSNIYPIAIYAVTSFIVLVVCKKKSKYFGFSAVPVYNKSLGSKYELHKY